MKSKKWILVCFCTLLLIGGSESVYEKYSRSNIDLLNLFLKLAEGDCESFQNVKYADKAYVLARSIQDDSIKTRVLFKIANRYYNCGHFSQYKEVTLNILSIGKDNSDSLVLGKGHVYLGDYYYEKFRHDSAYFHYKQALQLLNARQNDLTATIKINIAKIFYNSGDYSRSESELLQALVILRSISNKRKVYEAFNLLGIISNAQNDNKNALIYFQKALKTQNDFKLIDLFPRSVTYNNIGNTYQNMAQYQKSLDYFYKALQESDGNENMLQAIVYDNVAYSKYRLGIFSENIVDLFNKSVKIKEQHNQKAGVAFTKTRLAEYYLDAGLQPLSLINAQEALMLAKEDNDKFCQLKALKQLISTDPSNAAAYSKKYMAISDSMQIAERRIRNKFARIEYETDEIEIEKDKAIKEKWIYVSATSSALALVSLLFIIYRQKHRQREMQLLNEQQVANEEIYRLMLVQQSKVMEGRQSERNRISRDLHDGVMNQLTSTRLNLYALTKNPSPKAVQNFMPFVSGLKSIEDEVRNISHDLHKNFEPGKGSFKYVIESLFLEQHNSRNVTYHLNMDPDIEWDKINSTFKINIYRIMQECLQNINKHANAANIYVAFNNNEGQLQIEISDDGSGFDTAKIKTGIGLRNIQDRVASMGGTVDFQSSIGNGTKIKLYFPM